MPETISEHLFRKKESKEKQGTTTYLQRHIATFFRKLHPVSMSQLLQVIARREKQHAWSCISNHLRI